MDKPKKLLSTQKFKIAPNITIFGSHFLKQLRYFKTIERLFRIAEGAYDIKRQKGGQDEKTETKRGNRNTNQRD